MNITIKNLGVIEEANIELNPLTIFVGENNTGKTWTAYTLASIFGAYGWSQYRNHYLADKTRERYSDIDLFYEKLINEGNSKIDILQFSEDYAEKYINDVAYLCKIWMNDYLNSSRVSFDELDISIKLGSLKKEYLKRIREVGIESKIGYDPKIKEALVSGIKEAEDNTLYFYTQQDTALKKLPRRAIKEMLIGTTFQIIHRQLYRDTPIFPTERTTFVTLPINIEERQLTVSEGSEPKIDQSGNLIKPVVAFLDMFLGISQRTVVEREKQVKGNSQLDYIHQLSHILENKIFNGKIDFSTPEPSPLREIIFKPTDDVSLEIPIISSMVKELLSLVLYLRFVAEPNDLIVIDEPEMNLHPEAQVKLMEFLVMLVNAGLNVLFTTHSPYMVDHLVNLMKAAESDEKETIKDKFFLKDIGAFIPKEKVSIYLFENGTAKNILEKDGLIDWGTFANVSDKISQLYFEI